MSDKENETVTQELVAYSVVDGWGQVRRIGHCHPGVLALQATGQDETVQEGHVPFTATESHISIAAQRRQAYPPLTDLADALYWQAQGNALPMQRYLDAVKTVKDCYPKT